MIHNYDTLMSFELAKYNARAAEGDIATVAQTGKTYIYKDNEWQTLTADIQNNISLSLYDLNKTAISQLKGYSKKELQQVSKDLTQWINTTNKYYLMLNHELRYVTMFEYNERTNEIFGDLVIECAQAIGILKLIDIQPDHCEIWITKNDEAFALQLFPYDQGVVYYG